MVPPEKIRTIDDVERKFVWGLVVFGAVLSTLFLFVHQTGYTTKAPTNGACSDGWELVKSTCQQAYTMTFKEYLPQFLDRKSTRLNSSHSQQSRMPSSA